MKSVKVEDRKPEPAAPKSGLHGVAAILSRRMAIQGNDESDSDSDDGWDDEDF